MTIRNDHHRKRNQVTGMLSWLVVRLDWQLTNTLHPDTQRRIACARHELKCRECRVTWYSWMLRLLGIGGMAPLAKGWRRGVT